MREMGTHVCCDAHFGRYEDVNGLSERIAKVVSETSFHRLPREAVSAAESSLLDAIGVSLAASGLDAAAGAFARMVLDEGGRGDSTVLGFGGRVPAAAAAFANGALAHALDFEDAVDGLPVHPNAQVIPAVLALAERHDASGEELLTAIAVGADLTCRLGAAVGTTIGNRGWYPPPILGALGATAGCANLLGFDVRQTLDAFSLVLFQHSSPGEIKYSPDSQIRGIRDAFASHAAVRAAELARQGIGGFDKPFEGRAGFFAAYSGGEYSEALLLDGLGEEFLGARVSYKPWPSCRGTHAFVEGALHLRQFLAVEEIESVELVGSPVNTMLAEPRASKLTPLNAIQGKFSLPYTVAAALRHGRIDLDSFTDAALQEPDVLQLARVINFFPDQSKTEDRHMTFGRTTIRTKGGRIYATEVSWPMGNPQSPMGRSQLREKFRTCSGLASQPMGAGEADAAAERLLGIRCTRHLRKELGDLFARR